MSELKFWPAKPEQYEPLIRSWAQQFPDLVQLEGITQPTGHTVYALTITDPGIPLDRKKPLLFDVPHAHEPAGTVASLRVINQLLTGKDLDGRPTDIDREQALRRLVLCFIPDANPAGRARAPEDVWDGTKYTNEEFLKIAFGVDAMTGERFTRYDRWREQEHDVQQLGIVWEPLGNGVYVEPNRHKTSSLMRLVHRFWERYELARRLSLHQTEFEGRPYNCMILLPIIHEELPPEIRAKNEAWGEKVVAAWREAGYNPVPNVRPLGYGGIQKEYFVRCWRDFFMVVPDITSEVQNNNVRTPPEDQQRLSQLAIKVTIADALAEG